MAIFGLEPPNGGVECRWAMKNHDYRLISEGPYRPSYYGRQR